MNDKIKRCNVHDYLHPVFRKKLFSVLCVLGKRQLPFEMFEGHRSPERQALLYDKRPRVTRAKPWRSMHQYGLAADLALRIDGRWSWSTKTEGHRDWWAQLHEIARAYDLEPISWEKPHIQLTGYSIAQLRRGRYPGGGDDPWVWNLNNAILRYPKGAPPLAEYDDDVCRPATEDGLDHEN